MFVQWKVPQRLLSAPSGTQVQTPAKKDEEKKDTTVPNIPLRKTSASPKQTCPKKKTPTPVEKNEAPKSAREAQKPQNVPAMPRRSKTTVAETPRQRSTHGTPRQTVTTPQKAAATPRPEKATPRQSPAFIVTNKNKKEGASELKRKEDVSDEDEDLAQTLQPQAVDKAEEWLKKAPEYDRHVIEKVLRMTEKKQETENALKTSLLPDAKQTVDKWLQNASEKERTVALQFFNSLAGSALVGMTKAEQRKRLQQVIMALESGEGRELNGPNPVVKQDPPRQNRMRYVRLLTPATRKNRWMHTTWHHLPEYKDDNPNGNWSSHYVRPQAVVPRHFSIHPDWGS